MIGQHHCACAITWIMFVLCRLAHGRKEQLDLLTLWLLSQGATDPTGSLCRDVSEHLTVTKVYRTFPNLTFHTFAECQKCSRATAGVTQALKISK